MHSLRFIIGVESTFALACLKRALSLVSLIKWTLRVVFLLSRDEDIFLLSHMSSIAFSQVHRAASFIAKAGRWVL